MADSYTNPNTVNDATNKNVVGEGAGYVNNGVITTKRPKGPGSYKARTFSRMNPLDFEPDVALGLSLPFNDPNGRLFDLNYLSIDQALTNLNNLLLTRKGERVMHPNFGTRLTEALFEQNFPAVREFVQQDVEAAVTKWLPYIKLESVEARVPKVAGSNPSMWDPLHGILVKVVFGLKNNRLDKREIVLDIKAD